MSSAYVPPEPEYATVHEYCKLRNLVLERKQALSLGRRAAHQSQIRGIPTTRRRASPINPGKMSDGYRVNLLDELIKDIV